ncbi:MAG: hypothetical protein HRT90_11635 [Candidatus Margulisbacteria bacterium]|nr:hypothetical protein [Candidatus Margulisiibacteriota bacterium]
MGKRKNITTRLDPDLVREAKILAAKTDRTFNDVLEEGIREAVKKYEKSEKDKEKMQK